MNTKPHGLTGKANAAKPESARKISLNLRLAPDVYNGLDALPGKKTAHIEAACREYLRVYEEQSNLTNKGE